MMVHFLKTYFNSYHIAFSIFATHAEGQRSLFDSHKNSGASVRRNKILRNNRSYNEQGKQRKVGTNNFKLDDERAVSLFENKVDGSPGKNFDFM